MMADTKHQENNAGLEQEEDNAIDQPLGVDKRSLKEAADAIIKANAGDTSDEEEISNDEGGLLDEVESADPLVTLVNDLKVVHAENDELHNKLLRSSAEMENLRKRTRKEVVDAREFSIASFARDLLGVSDNLRRAIDAVPTQDLEAQDDSSGLKNLVEGVSLTERELLSALEKHKIRKMVTKGEKFDPNFHQAMFEVPDKEIPNNTVMEVVQDGYVIGERMLRPAMVGVSKGGPKTPKNSQACDPSDPEAQPDEK